MLFVLEGSKYQPQNLNFRMLLCSKSNHFTVPDRQHITHEITTLARCYTLNCKVI